MESFNRVRLFFFLARRLQAPGEKEKGYLSVFILAVMPSPEVENRR
jgi:hypothetical protein